ncbi:hypothetical protein ACFXKC_44580 [Streptomyces sp. NPDC059340]
MPARRVWKPSHIGEVHHSDLDDLLARLDRHAADHQEESSFRLAA